MRTYFLGIKDKFSLHLVFSIPPRDCKSAYSPPLTDCFVSDKNNPRMSTENCNIRGQEDDLTCRPDGATRDKLVMLATDLVGLGVVMAVYKIVSS